MNLESKQRYWEKVGCITTIYVCIYTLTTLEISVVSSIEVGSITAVDTTGSISVHIRNINKTLHSNPNIEQAKLNR